MKRTAYILISALAVMALLPMPKAQAAFSKPILVGGDAGVASSNELRRTSQATHLMFFRHPPNATGTNFKNETNGEDQLTTPGIDVKIEDLVATPGYKDIKAGSVEATSDMLDRLVARFGETTNPVGMSPDDFWWTYTDNGKPEQKLTGITYTFTPGRNLASHRLVMADVHDVGNLGVPEVNGIFGMYPALEEELVGNASEAAPYTADLYPTTVGNPFQFCMINGLNVPGKSWPCLPKALFGPQYSDVILYDIVEFAGGLISASYDSLALQVDGAAFVFQGNNLAGPMEGGTLAINANVVPYYSPLALFRKVGDRYRFSGYTSFDLNKSSATEVTTNLKAIVAEPSVASDPTMQLKLMADAVIHRFTFGNFYNWLIPMMMNPIALDKVHAGNSDYLTVAYQGTLFGLEDYLYDFSGRPLVVLGQDSALTPVHAKYGTVLGTCDGGCTDKTFKPLNDPANKARFVDTVVSPVVVFGMPNTWLDAQAASTAQTFVNQNPSHVLEPQMVMMAGPGMYDTEILHDTNAQAFDRLLVPSAYGLDKDYAYFYVYDQAVKEVWARTVQEEQTPTNNVSVPYFVKTEFRLPSSIIKVPRPQLQVDNFKQEFIPYQVKAANFDKNTCQDFVVTWRGADAYRRFQDNNIQNANQVTFSSGTMGFYQFWNGVTIVQRKENGAACDVDTISSPNAYANGMPATIQVAIPPNSTLLPEIASVDIGDVDGDGNDDIVMGDVIPRSVAGSTTKEVAAHVWISKGPIFAVPSMNDRVRVGVLAKPTQNDKEKDIMAVGGVAQVRIDKGTSGPQKPIATINGLPLMLPEIDCPYYTDANNTNTAVGSVYETYNAIDMNFAAAYAQLVRPGLFQPVNTASPYPSVFPTTLKPQPTRCSTLKACVKNGHAFPFYETDPCCVNPCSSECGDQVPSYYNDYPNGEALMKDFGTYTASSCFIQIEPGFQKQLNTLNGASSTRDEEPSVKGSAVASQWRPDTVVVGDGHAIGNIEEMEPAGCNGCSNCGNGAVDQGEDCDPSFSGNLSCTTAGGVEGICGKCKCVPFLDPAVKLPRGVIPDKLTDAVSGKETPYHREMSVVVWKTSQCQLPLQPPDGSGACPQGMHLEGNCCAPDEPIVKCGDFVTQPLNQEDCDMGPNGGNNSPDCTDPLIPNCDATCKCVRAPQCASGQACGPSQVCGQNADCVNGCCVPKPVCNRDGKLDPGEKCDTANLNEPEFTTTLNAECNDSTQGVPVACEMKDCTCRYKQLACTQQQGAECTDTQTCITKTGNSSAICDVGCKCVIPSQPGQPGTQPSASLPPMHVIVKCLGFSSPEMQEKVTKFNQAGRDATGITDSDWLCEADQNVQVLIAAPGSIDPKASVSASASVAGVLPYMLVQHTGSEFIDTSTLPYIQFTELPNAVRILPQDIPASAQSVKAAMLPDLSASADPDIAPLAGISPMAATSLRTTNGVDVVNNMIEHRVLTGSEASAKAQTTVGTTTAVHDFTLRMPPLCGPWTGVEGAESIAYCQKPIEERTNDGQQFLNVVKEAAKQMTSPDLSVYTDFVGGEKPWEKPQKYQFTFATNTQPTSAQPTPQLGVSKVQYAIYTGLVSEAGRGGGCGCMMGGDPTVRELLPMIVAFLIPVTGIAVRRIRRR